MVAFRAYLHPRRLRRRATVWYHRFCKGRSGSERLSAVEKLILKAFYSHLQHVDAKLEHYVNGVFAKELVITTASNKTIFRLVDNATKVFFLTLGDQNVVIETYVSPKTLLLMNRLYDKEFDKRLKTKKEAEHQEIREVFKKFSY